MDLVLKLRELRRMKGLSQLDVAEMSGVGVKTISSFETGVRIDSLKLSQLRRILAVYGVSEAEFFGGKVDIQLGATIPRTAECEVVQALNHLSSFPRHIQQALAQRIRDMVTAAEVALQ